MDAKFLREMLAMATTAERRDSMRRRLPYLIIAGATLLACLQSPSTVLAQGRGAAPAQPAPRLPNGHPDLSGVWMGGGGIAERNLKPGDAIVLTPEAKKIMDARQSKDDPEANCLPGGVPRMNPYPWRMVQSSTHKPE